MTPVHQALAHPDIAPLPWSARSLFKRWLSPRSMGLMAVLMFAMTIPMTRLANGHDGQAPLPALFVALGRGALAAVPAACYLAWCRAAWPPRAAWPWLVGVVLGGVLAFPLCMGWAVRTLPAWHASVVTGVLPLVTATLAAWWLGHRPRLGFWMAGLLGVGLVLCFACLSAPVLAGSHGLSWSWPDALLLLGLVGASVSYVAGARAAQQLPVAQVMSWALVWALPLTLPGAVWAWWQAPGFVWTDVHWSGWLALLYVAVFSSWLGFFAWYWALSKDAMRVSQLQLLQPFAAMALSAVLLGERVSPWAPVFAMGVAWSVWLGQRHIQRPLPFPPLVSDR